MNKKIEIMGARVMNKEFLEIKGTGRSFAKIDIGDNTSFNLHPNDPLVKKLAIGREVDVTAKKEVPNVYKNENTGATTIFMTLEDVEINDIRESQAEEKFKGLSDDTGTYEKREIERKAPQTVSTKAKETTSDESDEFPA